jgi:hypothetical protein
MGVSALMIVDRDSGEELGSAAAPTTKVNAEIGSARDFTKPPKITFVLCIVIDDRFQGNSLIYS